MSVPLTTSPDQNQAQDFKQALQPSSDELQLLPATARRLYKICDLFVRRASWVSLVWISTFMRGLLWFCGGRRYRIHGQDQLDTFAPETSVILVANHRSFFDFSVITYATVTRSRLTRRVLFPVRSDFFYDRWLGGLINMGMTGMAMFPPITRDKEQMPFNRFALARLVEELSKPGIFVGMHPEGYRNKGEPYDFLPARPGVGKVVLEAEKARVIPIFILGMGNNLPLEIWRNWLEPEKWPIDICFGEDIDFSDLRRRGKRSSTQLLAARRCMDAIAGLARGRINTPAGSRSRAS